MLLEQITFGVELEMSFINPTTAAQAVKKALITCGVYGGPNTGWQRGHLDTEGRLWKVVTDCTTTNGSEVVTPICRIGDMPVIQEVLRELVRHGGRATGGAGLHMHIGMQNWTEKQFANLIKFSRKYERVLTAMCGTSELRESRWCQPMVESVVQAVIAGQDRHSVARHQPSRYFGVNLAALRTHGTVEFRFLTATAHAGKLRSQLTLMLMCALYCANAKRTSAKQRDVRGNTKYAARVLMKQVGMVGEQFSVVRKHILAALEGDSVLNRIDHHGYESWAAGRVATNIQRRSA